MAGNRDRAALPLSAVDRRIQTLIRFDTTNGRSPERPCMEYIQDLLEGAGVETTLYYRDRERPNLFARLPAHGKPVMPPLLLYGHVDVVPVDGQSWSCPPFAGEVRDGYLYGRGAIDMKGQVAMFLELVLRLRREEIALPYELRLLLVSDEEASGDYGMKFLVREHPELFSGVRWALGEIGGFSQTVGNTRLYPVMVAEKQYCHIKITAEGKGGHGSFAHRDTAVERLARAVVKLSERTLPLRLTPSVDLMVRGMADALGGVRGRLLRCLLRPALTGPTLRLLGAQGEYFGPLLRNNINVTILEGGTAPNVIPAEASCRCDLRIVPGCTAEEALADVRGLIGDGYRIEIVDFDPGTDRVDMSLFPGLAEALEADDPEGAVVPLVLSAVTDGRHLATLGIQTYGYTPMAVPADYDFTAMAHAADERIPLGAADFGVGVLYRYICQIYGRGEN